MIGRGLSISFSCAPSSPQRSRSSWRLDLDTDSISCPSRLEGEIGKRGVIDVLRRQARPPRHRPVLWGAVAGQPQGSGSGAIRRNR